MRIAVFMSPPPVLCIRLAFRTRTGEQAGTRLDDSYAALNSDNAAELTMQETCQSAAISLNSPVYKGDFEARVGAK